MKPRIKSPFWGAAKAGLIVQGGARLTEAERAVLALAGQSR